jgi:hypothetical protein
MVCPLHITFIYSDIFYIDVLLFCVDKAKNFTKEQEEWKDALLDLSQKKEKRTAFLAVLNFGTTKNFGLPRFNDGDLKEGDVHPDTSLPINIIEVYPARYGSSLRTVVSRFAFECSCHQAKDMSVTLTAVNPSTDNKLGLLPDWCGGSYYPDRYITCPDKALKYKQLFDSCYVSGSFFSDYSALIQKIMLDEPLLSYLSGKCETDVDRFCRDFHIRSDSTFQSPETKTFRFRDNKHADEFSDVVQVLYFGNTNWGK